MSDEVIILPALSEQDRLDLEECERVIKEHARTCLMVMNAIIVAERRQLYREKHKTLKAWLDTIVPQGAITARYSYYLIEAAITEKARQDHAPETQPITAPRAVRALNGVAEPEKRAAIYQEASSAAAAAQRETPTYKDVEAAKERYLRGQDPSRKADKTFAIAQDNMKSNVKKSFHYIEPTKCRMDAAKKNVYITVIRPATPATGRTTPQPIKDIPYPLVHLIRLLDENGFDVRERKSGGKP
jgi:hypothetical protein